ncbi:MAG: oxidoreductase, partial [Actinomycetota bacterium]
MSRRHIVVVGGGTAGAVIAQSLAHSTDHDIVVVEPGVLSIHDDAHRFFDVLDDFSHHRIHEVALVNGAIPSPYIQARTLGGGSAINAMLLTGEIPDYVNGLVRMPHKEEIGPIGHSLLASGGRASTM